MVAEKERKNTISKIRIVQWWENLLPNKPLSRRSRSPRPPLLPQIQRDLGCNSVLPRINCSEWILHLASSVSRGFRFRRNVSPNEDTCLVQGITTRGGRRVESDRAFWSWVLIEFPDPFKRDNGAGRWWRKIFINLQGEQIFTNELYSFRSIGGIWGTFLRQRARLVAWGARGLVTPPPARLQ